VTWASNATGSLVDVAAVAHAAHDVGAEVFVDAVHYLPHGPIDVQNTGIDYMACSTYKAFAPHMGFGWGRKQYLDSLPVICEYFIPDAAPHKFEIGTYVYENVAGLMAAMEYSRTSAANVAPMEDRHQALHHGLRAQYAITRRRCQIACLQASRRFLLYEFTDSETIGSYSDVLLHRRGRMPPPS